MIANVKMFKMPSFTTMILHEWGCEWMRRVNDWIPTKCVFAYVIREGIYYCQNENMCAWMMK